MDNKKSKIEVEDLFGEDIAEYDDPYCGVWLKLTKKQIKDIKNIIKQNGN